MTDHPTRHFAQRKKSFLSLECTLSQLNDNPIVRIQPMSEKSNHMMQAWLHQLCAD
jgi:hypothetical protein